MFTDSWDLFGSLHDTPCVCACPEPLTQTLFQTPKQQHLKQACLCGCEITKRDHSAANKQFLWALMLSSPQFCANDSTYIPPVRSHEQIGKQTAPQPSPGAPLHLIKMGESNKLRRTELNAQQSGRASCTRFQTEQQLLPMRSGKPVIDDLTGQRHPTPSLSKRIIVNSQKKTQGSA